ncbi:response regulator transcription factor [Calidifontibacter sp. DB0510]|uniref:Response regulator transcription factor n=1 Tax=Metallococcus carri TaxID=1656884 RepID=A0A967EGT7_9MICO|nr:response regulator transcription factor [Metallococcus carri]NHN55503.1 response regulator transcription factor [Metallococcus carri]NOP38313.1 response regulator transcription factor [Calidifontibacter sp. DB2511S]
MARLLLLTGARGASVEVLPALALLGHRVKVLPPEFDALVDPPETDAILLDARRDLAGARSLSRLLRASGMSVPLLAIFTEGGLAALTAEWQLDDVLLETAGPAEVEARLRLAMSRIDVVDEDDADASKTVVGDLVIDEHAYTARIGGRLLDLTYKEFELLKHLAQHHGRVLTRAQLLQEVWGYDYFGGTRTVDVHVRRLRAKLGPDNESLIGTVRNVGYRFIGPHELRQLREEAGEEPAPSASE